MERVLIITEEVANRLRDEYKLTHYKFVNNVMSFVDSLLQDPVNTKPSDILCRNGFDRNSLLKHLVDDGIVTRESKVGETDSDKPESVLKVKFKVPKKDFVRKLNKLYSKLFECNCDINKMPINEDGEGGGAIAAGGDGGAMSSGASGSEASGATSTCTIGDYTYTMPLFGMVRRTPYGYKKKTKKNKLTKDALKRGGGVMNSTSVEVLK